MQFIGLSGPVSVGKDTIADYLVDQYAFTKFSFSDALYEEVAAAFGIDKAVLYKRETKETPLDDLCAMYCKDMAFGKIMFEQIHPGYTGAWDEKYCSPRQVLQWWGTEYRRKQDPEYWIKKSIIFIEAYLALVKESPEVRRGGLVNCSVRFPNEVALVRHYNGVVWHVKRPDWEKGVQAETAAHVAEAGLPREEQDYTLVNNGTIEQLRTGVSLLLQSKPGSTFYAGGRFIPDNVKCTNCGTVHTTVTRAQAVQEVAEFNQFYERSTEEQRKAMGVLRPVTVDDYEGCEKCGPEFRMFVPSDVPTGNVSPQPVIFEPA